MKKFIALGIFFGLAVIFIPWLHSAKAEQVDVYEDNQLVKSVVFKIGVPEYVVNGQTPGVKMDVAPFIQDDRTFVPVRFLGNALGVSDENINWNGEVRRVFVAGPNNTSLVMTIDVKEIMVDGQARAIDVAPVLTSDRTFLPARYVAEGLGYEVAWDEATQTVVCWPAGETKPDVSAAVDYLNQVQEQPQDQAQATPYVPAGWKQVSYNGGQAYIPPDAENRYPNVYFMEKGNMVQFDTKGLTISYPCKQFSNEKADQTAKDLLLSNIGDSSLVQQIWDYGAQKTTRGYWLPLKIFPGTEKFKEIQVENADGCIAVLCMY
ncbi:hypothetical protein Psch_03550 [Pelotomaculum schinkii]|uniref:Copper amine oxidase-like N-terminal domain-containing protein n=1 Tax=Pelotomaculum schinkii TaxID=78350 RepID=A0A4Y7R756_9FIRM|nr:copper amine oxidase N-terminal domain-containing protein [Pelotomaculum schinkii]TEB04788.1 hypothetical protein Psch_03550 [Pelotomaculum schinkii]